MSSICCLTCCIPAIMTGNGCSYFLHLCINHLHLLHHSLPCCCINHSNSLHLCITHSCYVYCSLQCAASIACINTKIPEILNNTKILNSIDRCDVCSKLSSLSHCITGSCFHSIQKLLCCLFWVQCMLSDFYDCVCSESRFLLQAQCCLCLISSLWVTILSASPVVSLFISLLIAAALSCHFPIAADSCHSHCESHMCHQSVHLIQLRATYE